MSSSDRPHGRLITGTGVFIAGLTLAGISPAVPGLAVNLMVLFQAGLRRFDPILGSNAGKAYCAMQAVTRVEKARIMKDTDGAMI